MQLSLQILPVKSLPVDDDRCVYPERCIQFESVPTMMCQNLACT